MSNEHSKDAPANGAGGGGNGSIPTEVRPEAQAKAEPETLEAKMTRLEKEKTETHERMLRIAAEFENYKKRTRRDQDDAVFRAREQLLREILPVLDNLERATQAAARSDQSMKSLESLSQGVKLVEKQLQGALEKFEIKGFESLGQSFDPNRHEAIQQVETDKYPAGSVAEVFARGYMMGERLLRAAMVAVAKPPADPSTKSDDGESE